MMMKAISTENATLISTTRGIPFAAVAAEHADAIGHLGHREPGREGELELGSLGRPRLEDVHGVADAEVLAQLVVTRLERTGARDADVDLECLRGADDTLVLEEISDSGVARSTRDLDVGPRLKLIPIRRRPDTATRSRTLRRDSCRGRREPKYSLLLF